MATLSKKIDIAVLVSANLANPNGDPLAGNLPRTLSDGRGLITDVCIKHKIRNALVQILNQSVLVRGDELPTDGFKDIKSRLERNGKCKDKSEATKAAVEFIDVRAFGATIAWDKISCGIRGAVSVSAGVSTDAIEIVEIQITKSTSSVAKESGQKSSDTMGMKYCVKDAQYLFFITMSPILANYTGFSDEDAEKVITAVKMLFVGDASSARPDGSMDIASMAIIRHENQFGDISSAKLRKHISVENNALSVKSIVGANVEII